MKRSAVFTIDAEDWFHILDTPATPVFSEWSQLEIRLEDNLEQLLGILGRHRTPATIFWLGWAAEQHPGLVRRCRDAGHEIACHGYAHLLAYSAGREAFRRDIRKSKAVLEDITGQEITGFRAAGFGIKKETQWAFEEIREAGFVYDSSIFPCHRSHGGIGGAELAPHLIETTFGPLVEFPQSIITVIGKRIHLFGGGYLRLAPGWLLRWGVERLYQQGRPLIVYVHPRDIDVDQPRLPLSRFRRFKSYCNLKTTSGKLAWLCRTQLFQTMEKLAEALLTENPDIS
ncbi:MAG: DUF3473 domain-containing protein [PVC group bacterium]